MKEKLDELTIDNFRIFAGANTFKFTDLNIYTGANNSGKSTIIKAIKLFSDGLAKSDFPALNLITENSNLGNYDNIITRNSDVKSFRIGFNTRIASIDEDFKVLYTFNDGKKNDEYFKENALFANFEIINSNGIILLGIYSSFTPSEREVNEPSVLFPSEQGDPGLVSFCLNVILLEKYLSDITDTDFSQFINHLNEIKGSDDYWWGEAFSEDTYSLVNYDIFNLRLKDFLEDLALDAYYNLADYNVKKTLYFGHKNDDLEGKQIYYNELLSNTNYYGFLKQVIQPIMKAVKSGLDLFSDENILHIVYEDSQERLIKNTNASDYLQKLFRTLDISDNIGFVRESLALFGIDGVVEIVSHLNTAFEVNLITDVRNVLLSRMQKEKPVILAGKLVPLFYEESINDYKGNPRINIADLGKGTANVIRLILKISSILFTYKAEKDRKAVLPGSQGREADVVIKKTILIEEPEAFLHPNWQSRLIDFFIVCLKQYDVQFIIETHSVYLIQRLQFLVAKGEFNPMDATLLYFNSGGNKDKFYKVNIRRDGILKESFGSGFYDETANLTADILNAQNIN